MKKNLLIIDKHRFGTLTDSYKWCEYLRFSYNITIVTPGGEDNMLRMDGVNLICVPRSTRIVFGIRYMLRCLKEALLARGPVLVVYFKGCDWIKRLVPWKKMILDIRTLSVDANERIRKNDNASIINACRRYDYVTYISKGVFHQLGIEDKKSSILPLGADVICSEEKDYSELRILYVGTLTGRHIDQTIEGIDLFIRQHQDIPIRYDIVGDGWNDEVAELHSLVVRKGLEHIITLYGRVPYDQLSDFFSRCNVGLSYIPQTPYFEHQPPTKTFEYVLSGLVCIATSTFANKEIVNINNGVLIDDNPKSFAQGLEYIWDNRTRYQTSKIAITVTDYSWESIVKRYLCPVLLKFES